MLVTGEYEPGGQRVHEPEPEEAAKEPALQLLQNACPAMEDFPMAQFTQIGDPSTLTLNRPGLQALQKEDPDREEKSPEAHGVHEDA